MHLMTSESNLRVCFIFVVSFKGFLILFQSLKPIYFVIKILNKQLFSDENILCQSSLTPSWFDFDMISA